MINTRKARNIRRGIVMALLVSEVSAQDDFGYLWHHIDWHRKWVPLSSRRAYDATAIRIIEERLMG